ncbi:hypothetical protein ACQ4PT_012536 [Festuca glaucescens]
MDEKPPKERDIEMGRRDSKSRSDYGLEDFFEEVKEIEMLLEKMSNMVRKLQNLRQTIQQEYREVVERRIFTVTGSKPSDEVIDNLIETGSSEQIFEKAIQGIGRGQILATVDEIQERHDVVMNIEKKLIELQQVQNAVNHVQTGTEALRSAKSMQKKSRKCMMIAIILLLVIAGIIVLSVLKPWAK